MKIVKLEGEKERNGVFKIPFTEVINYIDYSIVDNNKRKLNAILVYFYNKTKCSKISCSCYDISIDIFIYEIGNDNKIIYTKRETVLFDMFHLIDDDRLIVADDKDDISQISRYLKINQIKDNINS